MNEILSLFEAIVRRAYWHTDVDAREEAAQHPFEIRAIHEALPSVVRDLFDNGHYSQATFEAYKYIDNLVRKLSQSSEAGFKLMTQAFSETLPMIRLTPCSTVSEKDEQQGYKFLFVGSVLAIRNPRGHEVGIRDTPDTCLDHLSLSSMLLRRLEQAGFSLATKKN
jgi:uncharacterized protein (TIGR02391 family)